MHPIRSFIITIWAWIGKNTSPLVVMITAAYATVSFFQLVAMRGQLRIMRQNLDLLAKQWVCIDGWNVSYFDETSGEIQVTFEVKNPTLYPLTLRDIMTNWGKNTTHDLTQNVLIPNGSYCVRPPLAWLKKWSRSASSKTRHCLSIWTGLSPLRIPTGKINVSPLTAF